MYLSCIIIFYVAILVSEQFLNVDVIPVPWHCHRIKAANEHIH